MKKKKWYLAAAAALFILGAMCIGILLFRMLHTPVYHPVPINPVMCCATDENGNTYIPTESEVTVICP